MEPPEELSSSPLGTWPCMVIAPANLFPLLSSVDSLYTFVFAQVTWFHSVFNRSLFHKPLFALSKASNSQTHLQAGRKAEAEAATSLGQEETEETW